MNPKEREGMKNAVRAAMPKRKAKPHPKPKANAPQPASPSAATVESPQQQAGQAQLIEAASGRQPWMR